MSSGKKKLAIFFLLLVLFAIPATSYLVFRQQELRSQAVPATTLSFDPSDTSKTVGETFTLDININTGTNSISGAELHVQYDQKKLEVVSIDNASFLPLVLVDGSAGGGFAFITLGSQPSTPKKGTGLLATVTFKAIGSTDGATTQVKFTSDTRIAGTGEIGNVLSTQPAPALIKIDPKAVAGSPTPTAVPTATTAPTPTGTSGGGGGGGGGGRATPTPVGSVGVGRSGVSAATPTIRAALPTTVVTAQPTAAAIPVTADFAPTAVMTVGGIILTAVGILAFFAL